jgi:uncharacterized protein YbgA (DUF1722 family)
VWICIQEEFANLWVGTG